MESLRIALASDWYKPRKGGVESAMYYLARILLRRGHEPIIVTHQNSVLKNSEPISYEDEIPVVRFKVPIRGDDYTLSPKAVELLHDFLKHNRIDLVHGHSIVSPFANMAVHVGKGILGIPTVLTHHSLLNGDTKIYHKILLKYGMSRADELTAVSTVSKRDLQEIVPGRRVTVTPNCIETKEWRRVAGYELDGDPVLLYVSRLTPRKNPFLAIRAYERISRDYPGARLYIVGWGPLERDIHYYIQRKGLSKIQLTGPLEQEDIKRYMAGSDIFLVPGKREAFSLATLEAMSTGLPVVGFKGTGVEDLIIDGVNGYLAIDDRDFIEKTYMLVADEGVRRQFSHESFKLSERFDCNNLYPIYEKVYRNALDKCSIEKRFLLYRLVRNIKLDPVKPGEWCEFKRDYYYKMPPKKSCVPHIRRRARRSSISIAELSRY